MPYCPDQKFLDDIFPAEKADQFFDALYGGAEEGAYDIRLVCRKAGAHEADLAFELARREGKCLKCSLTYGLPQVFQRHPLIGLSEVARAVADRIGFSGEIDWELGPTEEINEDLHIIPLKLISSGGK